MHDLITVEVSDAQVRYSVIESAIRKSSKFFDNAMKPEWADSRPDPRVVDLSDEDVEIFEVYLHWLYFKTLPTVCMDDIGRSSEYLLLAECYIMGEKIMDTGFKNAVLEALVDKERSPPFYGSRLPSKGAICIIYEGTREGSPARRLLVDMWAASAGEKCAQHIDEFLPHSFVLELSRALLVNVYKAPKDKRSWSQCVKDYFEE